MSVPSKFEGDDEEALATIKANTPEPSDVEEFYDVEEVIVATGTLYVPGSLI